MNVNRANIDRIVSLVAERLQRLDTSIGHGPDAPPVGTNNNANNDKEVCWITDQVVSLASLDERLDHTKRINVRRGAVITPSAQDELRRRDIQVVYLEPTLSADSAPRRLLLAVWNIEYDPQVLIVKFSQTDLAVETAHGDGSLRVLSREVKKEKEGTNTLGVLLTEKTCAAACHLNREPHLRAAAVYDRQHVSEATETLNANVIVMDPNRHGIFAIRNLIKQFVRECEIS